MDVCNGLLTPTILILFSEFDAEERLALLLAGETTSKVWSFSVIITSSSPPSVRLSFLTFRADFKDLPLFRGQGTADDVVSSLEAFFEVGSTIAEAGGLIVTALTY